MLDLDAIRTWLAARAPDLDAVRAWADRVTGDAARIGELPAFGTAGWVALPDDDPRKLISAVAPAVARLQENSPAAVALRLRRELTALDRAVVERIRAAAWDVCEAQDWSRAAARPSWHVLERRRSLTRCHRCTTSYPWTAGRCPGCGRTGSAEEIRAEATRPWTTTPPAPSPPPSTQDRSAA
jgi:hypothetical protein